MPCQNTKTTIRPLSLGVHQVGFILTKAQTIFLITSSFIESNYHEKTTDFYPFYFHCRKHIRNAKICSYSATLVVGLEIETCRKTYKKAKQMVL
jgi:hypothetical protein